MRKASCRNSSGSLPVKYHQSLKHCQSMACEIWQLLFFNRMHFSQPERSSQVSVGVVGVSPPAWGSNHADAGCRLHTEELNGPSQHHARIAGTCRERAAKVFDTEGFRIMKRIRNNGLPYFREEPIRKNGSERRRRCR